MAYIWHPTREYLESSNVARLMRTLGVATVDELRARSVADVGAFWDAVVRDLRIPFRPPYPRCWTSPPASSTRTGSSAAAQRRRRLSRPAGPVRRPDSGAVVHESEEATRGRLTYRELAEQVARARAGLRSLGIGAGDAVALYLPMTPEAVVALYAVASLGAVLVPLFSGFAPGAIASGCRTPRRRRWSPPTAPYAAGAPGDAAAAAGRRWRRVPSVEHVVVVDNLGGGSPLAADETAWSDLLVHDPDPDVEADLRLRRAAHRLHVRDDRHAEGRRAHARRVPDEGGERGRLRFDVAPGRHLLLDHRHGLDHGPAVDHGHPRQRRDAAALRRLARHADAGQAVGARASGTEWRCSASPRR